MTIKLIDLLVKIANGEEVPKKIRYREYLYKFDDKCNNYIRFCDNNCSLNWDYIAISGLNDEVEIIEEDKKIEKLEIKDIYMCDDYGHIYINFKNTWNKINEIIDAINELKKGE